MINNQHSLLLRPYDMNIVCKAAMKLTMLLIIYYLLISLKSTNKLLNYNCFNKISLSGFHLHKVYPLAQSG